MHRLGLAIAACVGSKDFRAFSKDTAISWDMDKLYFTIFFSTNGGYWGVSGKAYVGTVFSSGRCWDPDGFNLCWSLAFNSYMFGIFFLSPCVSILVRSTSNVVANFLRPWNTKGFVTLCPNPFLQFPAELAEWLRIGSFDPCI